MDTAVLVVGAGPTGMMLAAELALAGTDVILVERDDEPSPQSRGGGVSARTAEVLAMRGLVDAVRSHEIPRDGAGAHFAGLPVPLDARPWRTRHPDGVLVPQNRLSAILEARLSEHGVTVRRGSGLTGLTQDDDGVRATLAGGGSVRAAFLVACDGGHSTVRTLLGAPFPGRSGTMSAVSADIDLASAAGTVARSATHFHLLQRSGGGYWMMLHPLDGEAGGVDGYRVVFGGPAHPPVAREAPVTPDEVASALTAVHGPETVLGRLRWGSRFSDASRQLTAYRHGRVLFAGDAAHIHLPVGGQGLNLGIQDAVNLGWKLAQVVAGTSPESLLDSYHAERHPVAARVLQNTMAATALTRSDARIDAVRGILSELLAMDEPRTGLAGAVSGLDTHYDLGPGHPLLGRRMPDLDLVTPIGPLRLFTLLHDARPVLLDFGGPGGVDLAAWADRVRLVQAERVATWELPVVGAVAAPTAVLVRPDGHVAWVGDRAVAGLREALTEWFGRR
jgi:2-polyprenyl-6-methoxyphenol hydroxylase-like FAD-dependent oxidoreductase